MKERTFNSLFPKYNEFWASKVLGIDLNKGNGPDLIDEEKSVEVKFKLVYPEGKYTDKCWRVLGHQLNYENSFPDFHWGLGFYWLNKEIKDISVKDFAKIEELVLDREFYLIEKDWVKQFPRHHQKGETAISKWDHDVLYPRMNGKFPKVISSEEVFGGKVFFTEGVDRNKFDLNFDEFDFWEMNNSDEVPF